MARPRPPFRSVRERSPAGGSATAEVAGPSRRARAGRPGPGHGARRAHGPRTRAVARGAGVRAALGRRRRPPRRRQGRNAAGDEEARRAAELQRPAGRGQHEERRTRVSGEARGRRAGPAAPAARASLRGDVRALVVPAGPAHRARGARRRRSGLAARRGGGSPGGLCHLPERRDRARRTSRPAADRGGLLGAARRTPRRDTGDEAAFGFRYLLFLDGAAHRLRAGRGGPLAAAPRPGRDPDRLALLASAHAGRRWRSLNVLRAALAASSIAFAAAAQGAAPAPQAGAPAQPSPEMAQAPAPPAGSPLTLERAIQLALERNYDLRRSEYQALLAGQDLVIARASILTKLNVNGSLGNTRVGGGQVTGTFTDPVTGREVVQIARTEVFRGYSASLSASQLLFDGGKWWNNLAAFDLTLASSQANLEEQRLTTVFTVEQRFFELVRRKRRSAAGIRPTSSSACSRVAAPRKPTCTPRGRTATATRSIASGRKPASSWPGRTWRSASPRIRPRRWPSSSPPRCGRTPRRRRRRRTPSRPRSGDGRA